MVCTRFAKLCNDAPHLLADVCVVLKGPAPLLLPKIRAFCSWLARHAAGLAQVVDIALPFDTSVQPTLTGNDAAEALESLLAAAAACAVAGPPDELPLFVLCLDTESLGCPLRLGSWAAGLGSVYELSLGTAGALAVTCSLAALALEELVRLGGWTLCLRAPPCRHSHQVVACAPL